MSEAEHFQKLRERIESFPRLSGYYKLGFTSIVEWRAAGLQEEGILERLFQLWGDHEPLETYRQRYPITVSSTELALPAWEEMEIDFHSAQEFLELALIGGGGVGHSVATIPMEEAEVLTQEIMTLFTQPRAFYGLGWANPEYVFENGIVLLDERHAGMFLVIEND